MKNSQKAIDFRGSILEVLKKLRKKSLNKLMEKEVKVIQSPNIFCIVCMFHESQPPHFDNNKRENPEKMNEYFGDIMGMLERYRDDHNIEYAVVGGCALKAHMGERIPLIRSDGTMRDIDVVVLRDPEGVAQDMVEELKDIDFGDVGITLPPDKEHASSKNQIFRQISCDDNGVYSLVFRDIQKDLAQGVMDTECVPVIIDNTNNSYELRTFSPGTLLHLYLTRIGIIKQKDMQKIRHFARAMKNDGKLPLRRDHDSYTVFHDFAREMRTRYKGHNVAVRAFIFLDELCHGAINHAKFINRIIS